MYNELRWKQLRSRNRKKLFRENLCFVRLGLTFLISQNNYNYKTASRGSISSNRDLEIMMQAPEALPHMRWASKSPFNGKSKIEIVGTYKSGQ